MKYVDLVTSQHQDKQKYVSLIEAICTPCLDIQTVVKTFSVLFDIDYSIGNQLDVDGQWIGRSRFIGQEISGVYFSWNDTNETGWGQGVWKGKYDPISGLTSLPDDSYRRLLKAKISANGWDGTIVGMQRIWKSVFENSNIIVQDNNDMSYSILITGQKLNSLDKAILTGGYLPLKPSGIRIKSYFISFSQNPVFGWGCDFSKGTFAGWGTGEWAIEL